jgi:hypothetical protein
MMSISASSNRTVLKSRTPGLIIEPKERGGEVTIQQYTKSCLLVDLQPGETLVVNNIRMLFRGPNKDEDIRW